MKLICWILGHRFNIMEFSDFGVDRVYICDRCDRCGKRDYEYAEMFKKYQAYLKMEGIVDNYSPPHLSWKKGKT